MKPNLCPTVNSVQMQSMNLLRFSPWATYQSRPSSRILHLLCPEFAVGHELGFEGASNHGGKSCCGQHSFLFFSYPPFSEKKTHLNISFQ